MSDFSHLFNDLDITERKRLAPFLIEQQILHYEQVPPSDTHEIEVVEDCCAFIFKKNVRQPELYLSTHTFYGSQHQLSTARLQACGFDVEIDNWDNPTQTTTREEINNEY